MAGEMKILRITATVLLHGPVFGMIGSMFGIMMAFRELVHVQHDFTPGLIAQHVSLGVFATLLALVIFPLGLVLHGVIAACTQTYERRVWRIAVGSSVLLCLTNPVGVVLGGPALILLFTLQTFKNMRTAEPAPRHIPSKAAADDFLQEEGLLAAAEAIAVKRIIAHQIEKEMEERHISKSTLARMIRTPDSGNS